MVVQRTINGVADENEISNQSQIFITSAGYKNTFAYEKLLQFLCESVVRPNESIVLGDTWRIKNTGVRLKQIEHLASGVVLSVRLTGEERKLYPVPMIKV